MPITAHLDLNILFYAKHILSYCVAARKKRSNFNQTVPYEGEVPTCPYPAAELKICTEYLKEKLEEVREVKLPYNNTHYKYCFHMLNLIFSQLCIHTRYLF